MRRLLCLFALVAVAVAVAVAPASAPAAPRSKAATAPTRTVNAAGVKLGYRSFGKGRPIVFIMGLSGTMDAWDPRFLDAVAAQGRRVIVFDNEGMGRSRMRPGQLTIPRMADDAAALIRALRLRRPDVFAWSMGGMIGQALVVRHRRLVRRIVLAATAPGDGRGIPPTTRGQEAIASAQSAVRSLETLFAPGAVAARNAFIANLALRRGARPVGPRDVINAQLAASGFWFLGENPEGRRIAQLRLPVLVAGGALDELLPVANQRHIARRIPGAKLLVYPRAAHAFFLQHRRDFLRRLDRFLR